MIANLIKILVIIALLSACSDSTENKQSKRGSRAHLVVALPLEKLSIGTEQHTSGSLTAIQKVKIFNQESGAIKKLPYSESDIVKQGDILVYIKNDKITAALAKSKATHLQAKSDLNRLSKLIKKNLTSQEEVSKARTALALAKAEEEINQIHLDDTFIKAPFSGVISERFYEQGDIVPLHSHILSLIDNSKLNITIQISELLISKLKLNSQVSIHIDALSNINNISGYISRIYPTIDPASRKGTLEIELNSIPNGAKPGQLTRVIIHTPAVERLLIDSSAIQYDKTGQFVYRVNTENKITKINIDTGVQIKNKIEIISGIKEDDLIVTEGFSNLKDGSKVKVTNSLENTSQVNNNQKTIGKDSK